MDTAQTTVDAIKRDDIKEHIYRSGVALTNYCHGVAREC